MPIFAIIFALSGLFMPGALSIAGPGSTGKQTNLRIGFLVENNNEKAAIHGASLAVKQANNKRKASEPAFEIVIRSMEGPWGTGSKQTVNLIFDENVAAIAGSFLGRNAHLAEQVCAKSKIPLVSARATDQTLTQAFVPWYFSVIPSDQSQAESLFNEICLARKEVPLLVCDNSYDARQAMQTFIRALKIKGIEEPDIITVEAVKPEIVLSSTAANNNKKSILLFSMPPLSESLIRSIRMQNNAVKVYSTLAMLDEDLLKNLHNPLYEGIILVSPEYWRSERGKEFSRHFIEEYGYSPGMKAAYAYDAVDILIRVISRKGTESGAIQEALSSGSFEGATGRIRFDEHGNRLGIPSLMRIRNGEFALY